MRRAGTALGNKCETTPDTTPNAALSDDPASVSDKRLETTAFYDCDAAAQVSFRNNYKS